MKTTKYNYIGMAMLGALALTSCQADMDTPGLDVPKPKAEANTTIADLKKAMWKDDTNYAIRLTYKDEASKTPYIIKGRVISSDASGNIYKSMYVQDATGAITFSINQNSLYNYYRVGQEIVVSLDPESFSYPTWNDKDDEEVREGDLSFYIGKFAGLQQIGGYGLYNGNPQVSFMNFELFRRSTELSGLPETEVNYIPFGSAVPADGHMYCYKASIAQINSCTSADEVRAMQSQLVELQNVSFENGGKDTFAKYEQSISQNLTDASGQTIIVRNSGYASFYADTIPEGTGNVRGLLSYFNGSWQLLLRSKADCIFDSKGTKDEPYSVAEARGLAGTGAAGWVKGYIVGSLKAGVTSVNSDSDIEWGTADPTDNNILIGASADTRSIADCILLPLPQGSQLRSRANLADNPGVYKKEIMAIGTFANVSGMPGIEGNKGTDSEFVLEGGSTGPVTPTEVTVFSSLGQKDANGAKGWTFDNVKLPSGASYIWKWKDYNSSYYLNASAYVSGSNYDSEAYAISPVIDLTGYKKASVTFDHAAKFQTTLTKLCCFAVREQGQTSWTEIKIPEWPAAGAWTFANAGNIDLTAYAGKKIQVAFKYASSTAGADTWEIRDLTVKAIK